MKFKGLLLIALVVSALISLVSPRFNPYYLDILLGIGINIILVVSLNLIIGFTVQFSLGYVGFMSVGVYVTAFVMLFDGSTLLAIMGGGVGLAVVSIVFIFV